jgi:hypothetical protein
MRCNCYTACPKEQLTEPPLPETLQPVVLSLSSAVASEKTDAMIKNITAKAFTLFPLTTSCLI